VDKCEAGAGDRDGNCPGLLRFNSTAAPAGFILAGTSWEGKMGVVSPELTASTFAARFNARDMAAVADLYTEDAVFTYDGAEKAVGRAQIEGAIAGFVMAGLTFEGEFVNVYVAGDTALTRMKWQLREPGGAVMSSGVSAEVQRRCADGKWRILIDDAGGGGRV